MSMPTNAFRNLNLGGMPETRSQKKLGQLRGGRTPTSHSRGRGRGLQVSKKGRRSVIPIPEHSRLLDSNPTSPLGSTEDLVSEFCVDRLQRHELPRGAYYAFQLKRPVSVRIFSPESGESKIECTCEDYQKKKSVCSHISWLLDGLTAVLTGQPRTLIDQISQSEELPNISELYNRIGERIESLPQRLNRFSGDATDSGSENSATEESQVSRDLNSRQENVKDILSVFDSNALPADYGRNFLEDEVHATASNKLFVPGNLAATIYEIAIRDEAFYRRLRKVVTRDICATSYFSKQRARAGEVMSSLDRFVMRVPSESLEVKDVDVPECARSLRLIVHQICTDRDARASKGPLGAVTSMNVAEILVDILAEVVCSRDKDVYEGGWERDDNEPRRNRNLYLYLIGDPPISNASAPFDMGDDFVIDRIRGFPAMEWSHLVERLTTILDHVIENSAGEDEVAARGSKSYARKLDSILREYTEEVFEPSTTSVLRRRPMTSPPASQRRRYV